MSCFRKADLDIEPALQPPASEAQPQKVQTLELPKQMAPSLSIPPSARKPPESSNLNSSSLVPKSSNNFRYDNQVKVRMKSPDREEWLTMLNIHIEVGISGEHSEKSLIMELTDENDSFFLYTMECRESEFISLKTEQNLVVDFQEFPTNFVELLELCPVAKWRQIAAEESSERFGCVLLTGYSGATFNVVETSKFKQLTHLSLKFKQGDDEAVKEYLARKLQKLKSDNELLRGRLKAAEDSFKAVNDRLRAVREESAKVSLDAQRQSNEPKEQMVAELESGSGKHTGEKQELENSLKWQIAELTQKLAQVQQTNNELSAAKRELTVQVQKQNHELTLLRDTNKDLDTTKCALVELKARFEIMQKQLEDKDQQVKNVSGLHEASKARCSQLEETISVLRSNAAKSEGKLIVSVQEANKGNDTIKQLQADLKAQKQKLRLKEGVCAKQEKLIEQGKRTVEKITRSLNDSMRDAANKEEELRLLKAKVDELQDKLAESQKMLDTNEYRTLR